MTPADLEAVLDAEDAEACIRLFATATEAERRAVAKTAAARLKALAASLEGLPARLLHRLDDETFRRLLGRRMPSAQLHSVQAAVLATATFAELKKFGPRGVPRIDDAYAVLSARRPPWLGEWADWLLQQARDPDAWRLVRRLVREGLCDRPRSPGYIEDMLTALVGRGPNRDLQQALLDDPGLLDDEVWEIFETEPSPGRMSFLFDLRNFPALSWDIALVTFAREGRIPRTRLLEASLGGLERDYHEMRTRWFVLVHEGLEATIEERAERADRYLGLLASRNASTVAFALKALAALEKAGRLDPSALLDAIGPALLARAKGTVRAALGLVEAVARRDSGQGARAAIVAVEAFAHESPEVHAAVLELVERHGRRTDAALATLLRERAETVAASQRARLDAWLGPASEQPGPEVADTAWDDLLTRASALDPRLRELAGVDAAIEAHTRGVGDVAAIGFSETEIPRLDPDRRIEPIVDLGELIQLYLAVLEDPSNPDDVESVLDGVSRLCNCRPPDFAALTGPLRARVGEEVRYGSVLAHPLGDLALAWIERRAALTPRWPAHRSPSGFFDRRAFAIAGRVARGEAAALLSAPTHLGGWIDPRALVERLRARPSGAPLSDRWDASLALLRLAPNRRAEALAEAWGLQGELASALRHALGSESEIVGPDAMLWVASARARAPREDDPKVLARHPKLGPNAAQAALCWLRPGPHPPADKYTYRNQSLIDRVPPMPAIDHTDDLPTVFLHHDRSTEIGDVGSWVATIWPLGCESLLAASAESLLGVEITPYLVRFYRPLLEPLFDPDVSLRDMGRLLLVGALSANTPELQGLAVDALIAAVDDGRLDGQLLGETVRRLLADGLAKPVRLAKALGDAARVSPLHAAVVARALQHALLALTPPPKDLHRFLEPLKELLAETGEGLTVPGAEVYLRALSVSGKTGRLANDILALAGGSGRPVRSPAARALAGRVERAERWARWRIKSEGTPVGPA